jgi:hypothetical protein
MRFRTGFAKKVIACSCILLALCLVAGAAKAQVPQKSDGKDGDILVRLEGLRLTSPDVAIAKQLLEFKRSGGGDAAAAKFFRDLSGRGAGMREVIGVKTKLREGGMAESFLGASYEAGGSPVEKALLSYRRQVTLDGIQHVVKEFAGRSSRNSIFLAEIGKWPHQSAEALTFSGDIDFSFVSNDTQLTFAMKQAYDAYILSRTGLTAGQIDSVSTAHGKATLDVYIGEHGRMYAEDQMRGGQLKEIDLAGGQVREAGIPGSQAIERMALEAGAQSARGSVSTSKYAAEPGLSLEMVRHFNHDIVQPKIFDPVDSVLKASKYLDRSNSAVAEAGGGQTSEFARSVTKAAESSDWKTMARLFKAQFGDAFTFEQSSEGGRIEAKVKANADTVNGYFESCNRLMWANAEAGFKLRISEVEQKIRDLEVKKGASPDDPAVQQEADKLRQEMVKLTDMVESEVAALTKDAHLEPSEGFKTLHEQFTAMVKEFNARFGQRGITPEELKEKKFVEELIKSKQKSSLHIAAAYVMDKAVAGAERANNILDYLDDRLLGELRGSNQDFDGFVSEFKETRAAAARDPKGASSMFGGLKSRAVSGIQKVNAALNETIQSSSAGRAGVKLMLITGLADETRAYYEAFNREGWGGMATEFFRRRVPGGSAVEQIVMENYMMAGWEVVKTLVPPLGMGEAAIYIGKYVLYDYPVQFYWSEQLSVFVDGLYAGAKFKLIGVESYESAKVGVWRLVAVKYGGQTISMESFIKYKKEQIDAMQAELKKPRSARDLSRSSHYGLTDRYDIDRLLRNTIAATDPVLQFVNEMMQHPSVGPKLASHLGDVYKTRWEEAKLGFVLTTIKQLEDRKAADDALARGQLPELFAELKKLATDLQIAELVEKNMDAELNTSNLKALMGWLWNNKRDLFSEGEMESDMTRGAEIVLRYLEAYRIVYDTRKETEELMGRSPASDHGRRILTGQGFLLGKIEEDKESAIRWYQFVQKTRAHAEKQLLEVKGECMAIPALDSSFDRDTLQALAWQQSWQGAWLALYKKETSGDSAAYAKEHNATAAELLKRYREQILKQGCAAVSITGPDKVKLGDAVVLKAEVKLPVVLKTPPVYRFQWSDVRSGMRFADATDTFKPKTTTAGDYQVKVEVFRAKDGAWERIGESVHKLAVELAQVLIKGPISAVPGEKVSFEAVTSLAAAQSTLRYAWRYVGSANILGTAQSLSWPVATTGKYILNVVVYQEVDRKSVKLGEATHTLVVELPSVSVYIDGPNRSTVGQTLTYRAKVSAAVKGNPQYTYTWSLSGSQLAGNASAVSLAPASRGKHIVRVEVFQAVAGKWQKAAEASYPLDVQEPYAYCTISTARDRIKVGESTTLNGIISETNLMETSQLYFAWQIDGRAAGTGNSISPVGSKPGTHTVTLEVWMNQKPRPIRLAATSRAVFVEAKPEDKKVVAAKPSSQPTAKKADTPKPVRNWSQLNDKERQGVLDCLCRCNSSATSSVAVSYDPKPSDGSPHCANMANGPCINQGFGCWRHVPEGGSKCAQECYGKYSVTGAPDSVLNAGKENTSNDKKKTEDQARQFNECVKGEKDRVESAQKDLARVGQKDAPMFFRCGPIGTNWQMIPSSACCDPFRRDSEKNMEAAAAALQRCGWNEEIKKRQADLVKKTEECRKKYPEARP